MTPFKSSGSSRERRWDAPPAAFLGGLGVLLCAFGNPGALGRAEAAPTCDGDRFPILITIEKVRSSDGTIKVELYGDDSQNSKGRKVARTRVKAVEGETELCLNAPSAGDYSIAFYHDENDNGKFDQNFVGIPKEGFGFSNNPEIGFSRPDHDEIRFQVGRKAMKLRISAVYL
jgi:uncharacterized protein (DUF2141 family)